MGTLTVGRFGASGGGRFFPTAQRPGDYGSCHAIARSTTRCAVVSVELFSQYREDSASPPLPQISWSSASYVASGVSPTGTSTQPRFFDPSGTSVGSSYRRT